MTAFIEIRDVTHVYGGTPGGSPAVQDLNLAVREGEFAAVDSVIKRNDVAKKDVELERLKMILDQNILTPWVKANGIGGIDKARFERALDQIGLTFTHKNKPKPEDIFNDSFLPPPADRKVM